MLSFGTLDKSHVIKIPFMKNIKLIILHFCRKALRCHIYLRSVSPTFSRIPFRGE